MWDEFQNNEAQTEQVAQPVVPGMAPQSAVPGKPTTGAAAFLAGMNRTAEAKTAAEAMEEQHTSDSSGDFVKRATIRITRDGCFAYDTGPTEGRRVNLADLKDQNGYSCRALLVKLALPGNGYDDDTPAYLKSIIHLTKEQRTQMQLAFQLMGRSEEIPSAVTGYKGSNAIDNLNNFDVSAWDQIVSGLGNRVPDLREVWMTKNVDWDQDPYRRERSLRTFRKPGERWYDGSKCKFFLHLSAIQPVPNTIPTLQLDTEKFDVWSFVATDYQSKSWGMFEKAMRAAYKKSTGTDSRQAREEFIAWLCSLNILMTIEDIPSKQYGTQRHPRFFTALKKSMGFSLFEVLGTPEYAELGGKPTIITRDEQMEDWGSIAGSLYVNDPTGQPLKATNPAQDPRLGA